MSSEWTKATLGEVTDWQSGGTPKKDIPSYWKGDIPWISANSMYGTRYSDSELRITEDGLENGSRLAPKNSVLLLVRGGALHYRIPVGITTREVAFNQDVKALLAKQEVISPWYLLFWLMGQEKFLLNNIVEYTGIGAGKLDTKRMQGLEILLPPRKEQEAIVALIKAIDDRIILLRETNATLEAIAQALFKSWFVDFDPVRAKMAGREPEGAVQGGTSVAGSRMPEATLDAETAALFPDSFEESKLGLVPKGWRVTRCQNIIDVRDGTHESPKQSESGFPLITSRHISDGALDFANTYLISDEDFKNISKRSKVVMCQHKPGHMFKQRFAAIRSLRVTYTRWQNVGARGYKTPRYIQIQPAWLHPD